LHIRQSLIQLFSGGGEGTTTPEFPAKLARIRRSWRPIRLCILPKFQTPGSVTDVLWPILCIMAYI